MNPDRSRVALRLPGLLQGSPLDPPVGRDDSEEVVISARDLTPSECHPGPAQSTTRTKKPGSVGRECIRIDPGSPRFARRPG